MSHARHMQFQLAPTAPSWDTSHTGGTSGKLYLKRAERVRNNRIQRSEEEKVLHVAVTDSTLQSTEDPQQKQVRYFLKELQTVQSPFWS